MPNYPSIPDPQLSISSLYDTSIAMKGALEQLLNQRGNRGQSAVTFDDLSATELTIQKRINLAVSNAITNIKFLTPSGGDDSEAFRDLAEQPDVDLFLVDEAGIGFQLTGQFDIYARVRGINRPSITLTLTSTTQRGLKFASNSGIQCFTITRVLDFVGPPSGGHNSAALTAGLYNTTHEEVKNFFWVDIHLIGPSGVAWNLASIMGDCSEFYVDRIKTSGTYLIPILCHWGSDKQGTSEVQVTYHPRNFEFGTCWFVANSDAVDSGNALTTGNFGLYFSGCHDFTVRYALTRGGASGHVIAVGEWGDFRAHEDSKYKVMSGIKLGTLVAENTPGEALWVDGRATKISYMPKRWVGLNFNMDVTVDKFILRRGNNASSTNPGYGYVSYSKNVHIKEMVVSNLDGEDLSDNDAIMQFTNAIDCSVNLQSFSGSGAIINSGRNITISGRLLNSDPHPSENSSGVPTSNALSNYDGVEIMGGAVNATLAAALTAGDKTITLDVTDDIYPGMIAMSGDYRIEFREGFAFDSVTSANNLGVILDIYPAPTSIISGGTIELLTGARDCKLINAAVEGFHTNIVTTTTDRRMPMNFVVDGVTSTRSRYRDVEWNGGTGKVRDSKFDDSNLDDIAGSVGVGQIEVIDGRLDVLDSIFNEHTYLPLSNFNIRYHSSADTDGFCTGNRFWAVDETSGTKAAVRCAVANTALDIATNNVFGPTISTQVLIP